MNIKESILFFERIKGKTNNKQLLKISNKFIILFHQLDLRDFTEEQTNNINKELSSLMLQNYDEQKTKHLKRKYNQFISFLKLEFDLLQEGYYKGIGIALGITIGASVGSLFEINTGVSLGMLIGIIIGRYLDTQAEKQQRVLKLRF